MRSETRAGPGMHIEKALTDDLQKQVHGVRSVANRSVVRRLPFPGPLAFGRGLEVTLTCDESQFEGTGVYSGAASRHCRAS